MAETHERPLHLLGLFPAELHRVLLLLKALPVQLCPADSEARATLWRLWLQRIGRDLHPTVLFLLFLVFVVGIVRRRVNWAVAVGDCVGAVVGIGICVDAVAAPVVSVGVRAENMGFASLGGIQVLTFLQRFVDLIFRHNWHTQKTLDRHASMHYRIAYTETCQHALQNRIHWNMPICITESHTLKHANMHYRIAYTEICQYALQNHIHRNMPICITESHTLKHANTHYRITYTETCQYALQNCISYRITGTEVQQMSAGLLRGLLLLLC